MFNIFNLKRKHDNKHLNFALVYKDKTITNLMCNDARVLTFVKFIC